MNARDAQAWVDDLLDERVVRPTAARVEAVAEAATLAFSPFVPEDARRAREASRALMAAADDAGGGEAGLEAALARFEGLLTEEDPALARFALKLFITHHPDGRRIEIPALERRAPFKTVPSGVAPAVEAPGVQEAVLNWYREDPEANEHHDHWHAVYPTEGIADPQPGDPDHTRLQDRQGELFFYMHQQMLARYDTERLAVGLGKVEPLHRYGDPVPEGYDPTVGLQGFPPDVWTPTGAPRPRPDGASMPDEIPRRPPNPPLQRRALELWRTELGKAVDTGKLLNRAGAQFATDIDALGHATEPSAAEGASVDTSHVPDMARYGNLHGLGHVFLSLAAGVPQGVMADTDTAIRDPVFYRWHRHIDQLGFDWQEGQGARPLADQAAQVILRHGEGNGGPGESPDIVLIQGDDFDAAELVAQLEDWDADFADSAPGTSELLTEMLTRPLVTEPPLPQPVEIPYLDQRPFAYAVRMENPLDVDQDVTVRMFIVADEAFDDRRMWIELDKFRHAAAPGRSVAVRRGRDSSVIRKPATKPPDAARHSPGPGADPHDSDTYCNCGWPYNLLLPRGTEAGMPFWIAAVVTDWSKDRVESSTCGSMSFCGARDRYPDARPMGYPFDRPPEGGDILGALSAQQSIALRSFRIRWLTQP
jgi:hypothetical protein